MLISASILSCCPLRSAVHRRRYLPPPKSSIHSARWNNSNTDHGPRRGVNRAISRPPTRPERDASVDREPSHENCSVDLEVGVDTLRRPSMLTTTSGRFRNSRTRRENSILKSVPSPGGGSVFRRSSCPLRGRPTTSEVGHAAVAGFDVASPGWRGWLHGFGYVRIRLRNRDNYLYKVINSIISIVWNYFLKNFFLPG